MTQRCEVCGQIKPCTRRDYSYPTRHFEINCDDCHRKHREEVKKIKDIEYANPKAELIEQHIKDVQKLTKTKEIIENLSKSLFLAKGIIRDLIDDTVDFKESKERATYCYEQEMFDTYHKAEQFLKDCEAEK